MRETTWDQVQVAFRGITEHTDRLRYLRNKYAGQTAYVLGCGASLNLMPHEELRQRLKGELVIAMKQAYLASTYVTDFHLLSRYKHIQYEYTDPATVVMAFYQERFPLPPGKYDIKMPLLYGGDFEQSVTARREFEFWAMDQRFHRCCGPGILYELGLYLPVHLGVTKVVTLGVDFDRGPHFYADNPDIVQEVQPGLVRRGQATLHGKLAEHEQMVSGIPLWRDWLATRGVEWGYVPTPSVKTPLAAHLQPADLPPLPRQQRRVKPRG